ncbi:hypothetical protein DFH06DRAFT_1179350 [Mycena polygramma]|nr:hypothetical protein DFH06DRAFT_1179350 [Mycena polygramma]
MSPYKPCSGPPSSSAAHGSGEQIPPRLPPFKSLPLLQVTSAVCARPSRAVLAAVGSNRSSSPRRPSPSARACMYRSTCNLNPLAAPNRRVLGTSPGSIAHSEARGLARYASSFLLPLVFLFLSSSPSHLRSSAAESRVASRQTVGARCHQRLPGNPSHLGAHETEGCPLSATSLVRPSIRETLRRRRVLVHGDRESASMLLTSPPACDRSLHSCLHADPSLESQ